MSLLLEFWHAILATLASADLITLATMLVIVLAAGLIMSDLVALLSTTVIALILFSVAIFVRLVVTGGGHDAAGFAVHEWHDFMGVNMQTVLVYALMFALGIVVVHGLRRIIAARN